MQNEWIHGFMDTTQSVSLHKYLLVVKLYFSINGELWNEAEVVKYLRYVYHPSRIVFQDKIRKILDELKSQLKSDKDELFSQAHDKLVGYCQKR